MEDLPTLLLTPPSGTQEVFRVETIGTTTVIRSESLSLWSDEHAVEGRKEGRRGEER